MQSRPFPSIADLNRGEVDGMEVDIVLAHELIEIDIFRVEPPLFPLRCIIGSDADIANAGFELSNNQSASLINLAIHCRLPKHL